MDQVANYIEPVTIGVANNYEYEEYSDDVYTVEEFLRCVETIVFTDYDGFGHPVKDSKCDPKIYIYPSKVDRI